MATRDLSGYGTSTASKPTTSSGTKKHAYAKRLMEKVNESQNRGLKLEQSYKDNKIVSYGTKGFTRLDVYDPATGNVYDYKFTKNPGQGLKQSQIDKIVQGLRG